MIGQDNLHDTLRIALNAIDEFEHYLAQNNNIEEAAHYFVRMINLFIVRVAERLNSQKWKAFAVNAMQDSYYWEIEPFWVVYQSEWNMLDTVAHTLSNPVYAHLSTLDREYKIDILFSWMTNSFCEVYHANHFDDALSELMTSGVSLTDMLRSGQLKACLTEFGASEAGILRARQVCRELCDVYDEMPMMVQTLLDEADFMLMSVKLYTLIADIVQEIWTAILHTYPEMQGTGYDSYHCFIISLAAMYGEDFWESELLIESDCYAIPIVSKLYTAMQNETVSLSKGIKTLLYKLFERVLNMCSKDKKDERICHVVRCGDEYVIYLHWCFVMESGLLEGEMYDIAAVLSLAVLHMTAEWMISHQLLSRPEFLRKSDCGYGMQLRESTLGGVIKTVGSALLRLEKIEKILLCQNKESTGTISASDFVIGAWKSGFGKSGTITLKTVVIACVRLLEQTAENLGCAGFQEHLNNVFDEIGNFHISEALEKLYRLADYYMESVDWTEPLVHFLNGSFSQLVMQSSLVEELTTTGEWGNVWNGSCFMSDLISDGSLKRLFVEKAEKDWEQFAWEDFMGRDVFIDLLGLDESGEYMDEDLVRLFYETWYDELETGWKWVQTKYPYLVHTAFDSLWSILSISGMQGESVIPIRMYRNVSFKKIKAKQAGSEKGEYKLLTEQLIPVIDRTISSDKFNTVVETEDALWYTAICTKCWSEFDCLQEVLQVAGLFGIASKLVVCMAVEWLEKRDYC